MLNITELPAKIFLGRGIDKKFPFLVSLYKKVYFLLAKNKLILMNIPLNSKLFVSSKDTGLGMYLRTKREFEPIQTNLFLKSIKKGDTVLDIGANIGYYTVLASKIVGTHGKVYAFEPDPNNLKLLRKNIKTNSLKNVIVVPYALSSKNQSGYLKIDEENPGESCLSNQKTKNPIKIKTLDNYFKNKKFNVIKMDIEGGEIDALKGAVKTIKNQQNLKLFVECRSENLVEELKKIGFKINTLINEFSKKQFRFSQKTLIENLKINSYVSLYAQK